MILESIFYLSFVIWIPGRTRSFNFVDRFSALAKASDPSNTKWDQRTKNDEWKIV